MTDRSRASLALSIVGLAVVAIGSVLPWVRPNPTLVGRRDEIPAILLPQMNAGLEPYALLVLVPAGVAAIGCAVAGRRAPAVALLAGTTTGLVPLWYLFSRSLIGFDGTFVPALGWYATVCGGVLLVLAGVLQLARDRRE